MTDNAAIEKKALELLGWERCGCLGHRINLIVKHSIDFPDVSKILFKCRKFDWSTVTFWEGYNYFVCRKLSNKFNKKSWSEEFRYFADQIRLKRDLSVNNKFISNTYLGYWQWIISLNPQLMAFLYCSVQGMIHELNLSQFYYLFINNVEWKFAFMMCQITILQT